MSLIKEIALLQLQNTSKESAWAGKVPFVAATQDP
jgi:hypothetical protein